MKPKLLLITAIGPFPMDSGGATRVYYTLKYLSAKYEIDYLSFGAMSLTQEQRAWLDQHCASWQMFPLRPRTLLSTLPYYFSCWQNDELEKTIQEIIAKNNYAKVRVEYTQIAYLVKLLPEKVKKVFVGYDVSAISFERRIKEVSSFPKKILARFNAGQIERFERRWLPHFDEVIAVSVVDKLEFETRFGLPQVSVEANGLPTIDFIAKQKNDEISSKNLITMGYIGSPTHPPNKSAIEFIINKIMPELERSGVSYQLVLAGKDTEQYRGEKIINLGLVAEQREFFGQIDYLVAPILAGSGTRIKILEALSFGVPVITTTVGAEGIDVNSPYLKIVADSNDEQAWAEMIGNNNFANNETVKNELKQQLRKYLWGESFRNS